MGCTKIEAYEIQIVYAQKTVLDHREQGNTSTIISLDDWMNVLVADIRAQRLLDVLAHPLRMHEQTISIVKAFWIEEMNV